MDIKLLAKILDREFTSEPDFYDLLGLKRFESDPAKVNIAKLDLIRSAREWQSHSDPSIVSAVHEILNTVSLADSTLTDLRMKTAYDAALRLFKPADDAAASSSAASTSSPQYDNAEASSPLPPVRDYPSSPQYDNAKASSPLPPVRDYPATPDRDSVTPHYPLIAFAVCAMVVIAVTDYFIEYRAEACVVIVVTVFFY